METGVKVIITIIVLGAVGFIFADSLLFTEEAKQERALKNVCKAIEENNVSAYIDEMSYYISSLEQTTGAAMSKDEILNSNNAAIAATMSQIENDYGTETNIDIKITDSKEMDKSKVKLITGDIKGLEKVIFIDYTYTISGNGKFEEGDDHMGVLYQIDGKYYPASPIIIEDKMLSLQMD